MRGARRSHSSATAWAAASSANSTPADTCVPFDVSSARMTSVGSSGCRTRPVAAVTCARRWLRGTDHSTGAAVRPGRAARTSHPPSAVGPLVRVPPASRARDRRKAWPRPPPRPAPCAVAPAGGAALVTTTSVRVSPYRQSTLVRAPGAYRAALVSASRTMPYAASATAPSGRASISQSTGPPSRRNPAARSSNRSRGEGSSSREGDGARTAPSARVTSRPVSTANRSASSASSGRRSRSPSAAPAVTTTAVRWWALTSCNSLSMRRRSAAGSWWRSDSARFSRCSAARRARRERRTSRPAPHAVAYSRAVRTRSSPSRSLIPCRLSPYRSCQTASATTHSTEVKVSRSAATVNRASATPAVPSTAIAPMGSGPAPSAQATAIRTKAATGRVRRRKSAAVTDPATRAATRRTDADGTSPRTSAAPGHTTTWAHIRRTGINRSSCRFMTGQGYGRK
ncbi:predicted protein [Streptomyces viridosporus ATCC 14672]|uniref:Predicted protein n=1 Tax=Streptomyces viridosporus (strain ATCC 14672 / DSM 40746 / JCM 4963 / KCTC 9882 / NRRL B-12104 / FH 1290) TaxID=566461 RepID=D5ZPJ4_STRV1|nr:predicted protein [Streptomyces viridosporus ATCC 14672]